MLTLIVYDDPGTRRIFHLSGEQSEVVGRQAPRLKLFDVLVSRRHAEVTLERGVWVVRDLRSSNGTFINGQRITGATELEAGDRITVGRVGIVVEDITVPQVPPVEPKAPDVPLAPDATVAGREPEAEQQLDARPDDQPADVAEVAELEEAQEPRGAEAQPIAAVPESIKPIDAAEAEPAEKAAEDSLVGQREAAEAVPATRWHAPDPLPTQRNGDVAAGLVVPPAEGRATEAAPAPLRRRRDLTALLVAASLLGIGGLGAWLALSKPGPGDRTGAEDMGGSPSRPRAPIPTLADAPSPTPGLLVAAGPLAAPGASGLPAPTVSPAPGTSATKVQTRSVAGTGLPAGAARSLEPPAPGRLDRDPVSGQDVRRTSRLGEAPPLAALTDAPQLLGRIVLANRIRYSVKHVHAPAVSAASGEHRQGALAVSPHDASGGATSATHGKPATASDGAPVPAPLKPDDGGVGSTRLPGPPQRPADALDPRSCGSRTWSMPPVRCSTRCHRRSTG